MNKPSWSTIVFAALFCALSLISCGPSRNDSSAELVSIEVTPANPVMVIGDTLQFKATGHYADNTTKDLTSLVQWERFPRGSGSISDAGFFTAGSGIITIGASGGVNWDITGTTVVNPAVLKSITITPAAPIMTVGSSLQFTATARFSDLSSYDFSRDWTAVVTWDLSNAITATVDSLATPGLVTARAVGTTTIRALQTYSAFIVGSTTITVDDVAPVSIAITPVDPSVATGNTVQFTATGTYADASTHDISSSVTWTSSDPGKATISTTGLATGVAAGSTIISATSGTASSTTTLTVTGGGGPSSTPIVSTGTMIKGSAIVNGIQFSDALANITADDIVKTAAFLQSGMTVKIKGSRNNDGLTGTADEIHVENAVRGLIHPFGVDSFWVNGQTVFFDGGTIYGNVADFASLNMGVDNVEVYGMRNAAGNIRATRVAKLNAAGVDEVRGTISAKFGSVSTTITIDTGSFNIDDTTTVLPTGASFDVGTLVEIKLTGLHVDQLKVEDAFDAAFKPSEGEEFAVEGYVTGFSSPSSSFFVDGQAVNASGALYSGGVAADLDNDEKVTATGHYIGTVLVADKIEFKESLLIESNITASDIAPYGIGQITLLGKTVFITSNTVGKGDSPLSVGTGVQVRGFLNQDNTTITATHISFLSGPVTADSNIIQGKIRSFDASTRHLDILGFDVNASGTVQFLAKNNNVITGTQFFGQLTTQSIVKAKGTASGSVLTATQLEIE